MTNGCTHAHTDARTDTVHFMISRTGPIGRREIITDFFHYISLVLEYLFKLGGIYGILLLLSMTILWQGYTTIILNDVFHRSCTRKCTLGYTSMHFYPNKDNARSYNNFYLISNYYDFCSCYCHRDMNISFVKFTLNLF